ncbi:MAG TPA: twin-arginine translocation signal domain-containing protein [Gemmatimonadales bacterium]|nr:twin-arginine translocation signal domain-containing protein [Gemmatimonadales bacterium]
MSERREFLETLALGGVALAVGACATAQSTTQAPLPAPPPATKEGPWDSSWLDQLTAKHKQVFDVSAYADGGGLFYAKNYFNAHRDAFGTTYPDVQAVLGIHGDAYPIVFGDTIWAKYDLGRRVKAKDPRTGKPALRNVLWQPREGEEMYEYSVNALQPRGAKFILCNNVLRFVTRTLAGETGATYEATRAGLIAGLLPNVTVVPAMVVAIGLAQERGCTYIYAGA